MKRVDENQIGDRLKQVREYLGDTQISMAARFGLGTNTWKIYEYEGRLPKTETLLSLADLGVSIDWLLTSEGTMLRAEAGLREARPDEPWVPVMPNLPLLGGCLMAVEGIEQETGRKMGPEEKARAAIRMYENVGAMQISEIQAVTESDGLKLGNPPKRR